MANHISKAEKLRIIEDFRNSGLSLNEFCKKYQVCDRALYRWRLKFAPELVNSVKPRSFIPVKIANDTYASHRDKIDSCNSEIKIITPSGFKIVTQENISKSNLLKIISCIGG